MREFNPIIVLVVITKRHKKSSVLKRCEWVNLSRNTIFYIDTNTLNQMSALDESIGGVILTFHFCHSYFFPCDYGENKAVSINSK